MPADAVAADLTNNLVPGVILVSSVMAYLAELQDAVHLRKRRVRLMSVRYSRRRTDIEFPKS